MASWPCKKRCRALIYSNSHFANLKRSAPAEVSSSYHKLHDRFKALWEYNCHIFLEFLLYISLVSTGYCIHLSMNWVPQKLPFQSWSFQGMWTKINAFGINIYHSIKNKKKILWKEVQPGQMLCKKKTFSTMLQWVIAYKETLALYLWTWSFSSLFNSFSINGMRQTDALLKMLPSEGFLHSSVRECPSITDFPFFCHLFSKLFWSS